MTWNTRVLLTIEKDCVWYHATETQTRLESGIHVECCANYCVDMQKPANKQSDVASMGAGEWSSAEEHELRALSEDLLGSITTLEGLSMQEKREMLQILRENLALRNRLNN